MATATDTVPVAVTWTDEQVARGRELAAAADNCPWELGDLSLEAIPARGEGGPTDESREHGNAVRAFATEIGVEFNTLRAYRGVATSWPIECRHSMATWMAHKVLGGTAADAPHRRVILDELAAGKPPGRRVQRSDVQRHLGAGSVRRNRRDKAGDVVDRFDKVLVHLEKVAEDPDPLPERTRKAYEARLDKVDRLAALWRDLATRGQ